MILLIEGVDGSGKTTLAKKLAAQTGYELIHNTMPKDQNDTKAMLRMYQETLKVYRNAIVDRCWYSEMVYGPIMREKSAISYAEMYQLERQMTSGAMIIHCGGPHKVLWKACQRRGEDYVTTFEQHKAIYDSFEELFHVVPHLVPVVRYAYQDMP